MNKLTDNAKLEFSFHTRFGMNEFAVPFQYCQVQGLPGRINTVIGQNGAGKTQLLANLARVARADSKSRNYGRLDPSGPHFGGVVAVSYSAFDAFEPAGGPEEDRQPGYTYCGLQKTIDASGARGLKDDEDLLGDIKSAIARMNTPGRLDCLTEVILPLLDETSFRLAGYKLNILVGDAGWTREFKSMGSGHKIAVHLLVQLVAALEHGSLVLIDEPEAHLHPPLLTALMKGIRTALEAYEAYAVIATHSPVVLQEIPGRYTHVLRRYGSRNSVAGPETETFGESIGALTRDLFDLDNSQSDYVRSLRELAAKFSMEEIEGLFDQGLSSGARALVMQAGRKQT